MKTKEKKCKCEIKYASDGKVRFWKTDCPIHTKSEVWLNKSPKPKEKKVRIEEQIEEVLRNRILYIGNEIPKYFTTDKRSKQLYSGYPQQLIDELVKVINSK
ncbi:MAG: hypothetical protein UT24_C0016G0039 [Candidatus Woesebacteria bacterium GW2011_GWB1_39_12]|uniref:Uncharacterized protein n=1 Tax=Candidatus Woesebacteria bacterium GW2011_GWB1_39_12 TaxID=1618574 RepID=A0A0G0PPR1_9BACT|nr:MAG: hypothetical protein UT24_C0016G0039 [Candidatus Woesebacteria bacterium GW2011_GWB1_39_12]